MRNRILTGLILLLLLVTSCEKSISTDEGSTSDGNTPTASVSDTDKQNALTISEAKEIADGTKVCVKGYLIACTGRSLQSELFSFSAPFKSSTAIVLSEEPFKGSDYWIGDDDMFPICLTDASKGIRDKYNLIDHPDYWNHMVYIIGTREKYMGVPGLKKVTAIEIGEAYQPEEEPVTPDDPVTPDTPDSPENPDNPGTPDNPVNPDNPVVPDNPTPDNPTTPVVDVLTVAQAKKVEADEIITVIGYIVGAVAEYDFGTSYQFSFDNPNYSNIKAGILLADKPYTANSPEEQYDIKDFTDLLPVSFSGCKPADIKKKFNLAENPRLHNKQVVIKGRKKYYVVKDGLGEITSCQEQ